jgi:hypothetical protein
VKTLAKPLDKAEIVERLRRVRPHTSRRWGTMSAHQMICHLADAFRMAIGERPVSERTHLLNRTIVKWAALYLPVPWPRGIPTRPEIDPCRGGTGPGEFTADLTELERLLERVTVRPRTFEWRAHPTFGSLSESAWLRWGYLHMDHHLRQFGL